MTDAVYYSALQNVETRIKALTLDGLDSSRVIMEPVGDDQGKDTPFISIWPGEPEAFPTGDDDGGNAADRVDYKILVAIVAAKEQVATMFPKVLRWREQIRQEFLRQTGMSGVTSVQYTEVEPLAVVDRAAWFGQGLIVSALRIVVISQEVRA